MRKKKKAFLISVVSMLLSVAMFAGTTYAWFTDSATTGINRIIAGNLDVELEYLDVNETDPDFAWKAVQSDEPLFDNEALWEPGFAQVVYLRIRNAGTLALKYRFSMNIVSETPGTNVAGDTFLLSDYIKYGVKAEQNTVFADRAAAISAVAPGIALDDYLQTGSLLPGEEEYLALVVYMPVTVGNEAHYLSGTTPPTIDLGITLAATQFSYESDSFDNTYDLTAPWLGGIDFASLADNTDEDAKIVTIETAEQLAAFAATVNGGNNYNGYRIVLAKDIDLNNLPWTPIGRAGAAFNGTFDGQNHTILNLNVNADKNAGLFGYCFNHAIIQNVKVVNATVTGHNAAGVILGRGYADIINCDVENATVTVTTWMVGSAWDDGDKAGAIVGQLSDGAYTVTGCDVKNVTVKGYRDIGGIAGYAYASYGTVFTNNTVDGLTLINDREHNYQNYTTDAQYHVNAIVGEYAGAIDASNIATNVTSNIMVTITPDNIGSINLKTIAADTLYVNLKGTFGGAGGLTTTIELNSNAKNVIVDGALAEFTGQLLVKLGKYLDNFNNLVQNTAEGLKPRDRVGNYTVQNVTALGAVSVYGMNAESVTVTGCTAKLVDTKVYNARITISNNTIDGKGTATKRADGSTSKYGIYVDGLGYELTIQGNTITGALKHSIGILGNLDMGGYITGVFQHSITVTGNTITLYAGAEAGAKPFHIWNDEFYASADGTPTALGNALYAAVNASNTINP